MRVERPAGDGFPSGTIGGNKSCEKSLLFSAAADADLADDVDEISSLEGQLIRLVALAVPQTLVVVGIL